MFIQELPILISRESNSSTESFNPYKSRGNLLKIDAALFYLQ
jgi:hypothetical protein